jgi:hypothetical protein
VAKSKFGWLNRNSYPIRVQKILQQREMQHLDHHQPEANCVKAQIGHLRAKNMGTRHYNHELWSANGCIRLVAKTTNWDQRHFKIGYISSVEFEVNVQQQPA